VQINDDGTHAILLVAMHVKCTLDHVRLPVMWLRRSDGKMRRDGSRAASLQPNSPVAERGRLHGASGLAVVEQRRVRARIRGPCRKRERKREWLRWRRLLDRLRQQDKRRKVRPVGCETVQRLIATFLARPHLARNQFLLCVQEVGAMCLVLPRHHCRSRPDQPTPVKARAARARLRRLTALTSVVCPGV
jgi:hypothetical protein